MFAQMCEAVATCHDASIFHRDIKPENFVVTDGWTLTQGGVRERKVIVKLMNFGFSTRDAVSSVIDPGSPPYMSYECRNNVAPVYKPRPADVWSLGIVLINMLYCCNPWMDTIKNGSSSFGQYLSKPADFMRRFAGMTLPVANFLVENVFCILDEPTNDSQRIGARDFGIWVRDLPTLMSSSQPVIYTNADVPFMASGGTSYSFAPTPAVSILLRPHRRKAFTDAVIDNAISDSEILPALPVVLEGDEELLENPSQPLQMSQHDAELGPSPSPLYSNSPQRVCRGEGITPSMDHIQTSELLASACQTLVRQLSRQSRSTLGSIQRSRLPTSRSQTLARQFGGQTRPQSGSIQRSGLPDSQSQTFTPALSSQTLSASDSIQTCELLASACQTLARELSAQTRYASASTQTLDYIPAPARVPVPASIPTAVVTEKPNRWSTSFGKSGNETSMSARPDRRDSNSHYDSARATLVANLIAELDAVSPHQRKQHRRLSNCLRTRIWVRNHPCHVAPNPDDDMDVGNESEDDNCEEEFFDVDSGSYNGPRSIKTISKHSFSTQSFSTRSVFSRYSSNGSWGYGINVSLRP